MRRLSLCSEASDFVISAEHLSGMFKVFDFIEIFRSNTSLMSDGKTIDISMVKANYVQMLRNSS